MNLLHSRKYIDSFHIVILGESLIHFTLMAYVVNDSNTVEYLKNLDGAENMIWDTKFIAIKI